VTTSCAYCSALFDDGLPGRFWQGGPRRQHETRCRRATEAERAHFRAHHEWPPSPEQLAHQPDASLGCVNQPERPIVEAAR